MTISLHLNEFYTLLKNNNTYYKKKCVNLHPNCIRRADDLKSILQPRQRRIITTHTATT